MKAGKLSLFVVTAVILSLVFSLGGVVAAAPSGDATAEFVSDEILVKFEPGTSAADIARFHRSQGASVKSDIPQIGVQVLKVPSGRVSEKVAAYEKNPNVVYAEPNYIRLLAPPNDASGTSYGFDDQWALNNVGQAGGTENADIDWLEAYEALSGDTLGSVVIAVNDTGIDLTHPDLNDKLLVLPGSDIIDNDNDPSDEYGHGTHVAGIAAAETNNSEGIAGVAFGASTKIMPVRIFDANGATTIEAIVNGLIFAADNGANVINMSYSGFQRSKAEANAVKYAWNSGAVLVAAAGNLGEFVNAATWKSYPAAYRQVMAVSATNNNDALAYYSSHGSWLSVAAPGGEMSESGDPGGILSTIPGGNYAWWQGTSMAAPHVTGLAALLFAQDPSRTNEEVRSIIEATADDLGGAGFDNVYGYGRINVYAAVTYASVPPPPPTEGTMNVESIIMTLRVTGPWTKASAIVTIVDRDDNPVSDATVSGQWSGATNDADSGTTNGNGEVVLTSDKLRNAVSGTIFTFTVSNVTKEGWEWTDSPGAISGSKTI